ncbi:energy-coupling factor ABC transporter ATP-binding protein [Fructobacillus sp. W13]|uniref:Energy-coupling factor ABC transporter ATP-binding protein n=1 Tax=Fructobacillus apis TaxID=2935017 RepID=A0ABT0ZQR8_9LACO|nr:ABC transporter ATP-binding protein [Fructobacillus apis]MCO0832322.1 energy-coupling factor ABC transporter ATP-binding protein [Fructobacillus apis]
MTLSAESLSLSYRKEAVFQNVNLTVEEGDFALIMGPSGCGKSTLFKCLAGLYPQYGGKVTGKVVVDGDPIDNIPANHRVEKVSMLFQNPREQFVLQKVEEELAFALENLAVDAGSIQQRIDEALETVHIRHLKKRQLNELSGGEMQKVALAEIIALGAKHLIFDEPFASVDITSREELQQLFQELAQSGYAVLVCDHDASGYEDKITSFYRFEDSVVQKVEASGWPKRAEAAPILLAEGEAEAEPLLKASDYCLVNDERLLIFQKELALKKGDFVLLTGDNGSGKSTFLRSIAKLNDYTGQLCYLNLNLKQWKKKPFYEVIGLTFQNALDQFLTITVQEEIEQVRAYKKERAYWTDERVHEALKALNLDALMKRSVYTLSGGQQKKLQVLLMLITEKNLLLLDEPFSGLDAASVKTVVRLMKESQLALKQTIIIVSHQVRPLMGVVTRHLRLTDRQLVEGES